MTEIHPLSPVQATDQAAKALEPLRTLRVLLDPDMEV
jgi:hypothetical protein